MNTCLTEWTESSVSALSEKLRRHRLVFVQHGAVFDGVADSIRSALPGNEVKFYELGTSDGHARIHVTGLENYCRDTAPTPSLGTLRRTVSDLLDTGVEICMWSRAPRIAFTPVAGSSLLEDASPFFFGLLDVEDERQEMAFPSVVTDELTLSEMFKAALRELGVSMLAALDRALFYADAGVDGMFAYLDAREVEALRGAGLAREISPGQFGFAANRRSSEFLQEVAEALSVQVSPQPELSDLAEQLWAIERTIRRAVRAAAIEAHATRWRGPVLHGDLPAKVLGRAMDDGVVGAKSAKSLRDPLEWLSLGELLEVVTTRFDNLGCPPIFWQKFSQDVLPVRNRLSHMRHFKHGDRSTVRMWALQISRALG